MKNNKYLTPSIIAISVFVTCMGFIFGFDKTSSTYTVFIVGGIYAFISILFLLFQLYAFIQAHVDYDEDVEKIKYDVFEAEDVEVVHEV